VRPAASCQLASQTVESAADVRLERAERQARMLGNRRVREIVVHGEPNQPLLLGLELIEMFVGEPGLISQFEPPALKATVCTL
jgi:hypothetical protein